MAVRARSSDIGSETSTNLHSRTYQLWSSSSPVSTPWDYVAKAGINSPTSNLSVSLSPRAALGSSPRLGQRIPDPLRSWSELRVPSESIASRPVIS